MRTTEEKIQVRQWANLQILDKLREFFLEYPDVRFYQGLSSLDIREMKDKFYEESIDTLELFS